MPKLGRPSVYSPEIAAEICDQLKTGISLRELCKNRDDLPADSTVRGWALDNTDGFFAQYSRARELGYLAMADEVLEIADDGLNDWMERRRAKGDVEIVANREHIDRSKLRYDARRWLLSKCLPKIYGDKLEHTGPDGGPIAVTIGRFVADERPTLELEAEPVPKQITGGTENE